MTNTSKQTKTKKVKVKKQKRHIPTTILSLIVGFLVIFGLSGSASATLLFKDIIDDAPTLNVNDFISPDSTKIYDRDGKLIADIGLHLRENITYDQLPQSLVDAFVSIEDSRYFEHNGFDLPRFIKAFYENIKANDFGQGGSTFTMQLVKNTYFVIEGSGGFKDGIDRKVQEISLAIELEKQLGKKRILELYLNMVNFGVPNSLGISNAAEYYFGKTVEELTIGESAYLAGVINAPTPNNAYRNIDQATKRRNVVLDLMLRHGYISKEENELAKSVRLENLLVGPSTSFGPARPYQAYVDAVIVEVIELTGKDPYTTPMNIYTHMSRNMQENMDKIQSGEAGINFGHDLMQIGAITVDHSTGQIVAMAGGRNYEGERMLNRAIKMNNQFGSTVKPMLSYALAFEYLGYSTEHILKDEPITYRGTNLIIRNADRRYRGEIDIKTAIGYSYNIPAINTLQDAVDALGRAKVIEYLNSIGFTRVNSSNFDIGYAIGGSTFTGSPMDLAGGYTAIFNGGVYIQPHTIARIEYRDGSDPVVPNYASVRALSAEAAYLSLSMMQNAVSGPFSNFMQILKKPYPVYGKTGTTDYGNTQVSAGIPEGAGKEYWLVAGNSKYVNTVWLGFDEVVAGEGTYLTSAIQRINLHGNVMKKIIDGNELDGDSFRAVPKPNGVVNITHVRGVFPYARPLANMNSDLIVTGQIKREFASLENLTVEPLENLGSFTYKYTGGINNKQLAVTFAPYPDLEMLTVADSTYEIDFRAGSNTVRTTGTRYYHPSWVFGPVRYVVAVRVDNQEILYGQSEATDFSVNFSVPSGDSTVRICGFYAYSNDMTQRSNEICETVKGDDSTLSIGTFTGEVLKKFTDWITSNNFKIPTVILEAPTQAAQIGLIKSISPAIDNKTMKISELKNTTFEVKVHDQIIDLAPLLNKTKEFVANWGNQNKLVNITYSPANSTNSWVVEQVLINNQPATSLQLSINRNVTVVLKEPVPVTPNP